MSGAGSIVVVVSVRVVVVSVRVVVVSVRVVDGEVVASVEDSSELEQLVTIRTKNMIINRRFIFFLKRIF